MITHLLKDSCEIFRVSSDDFDRGQSAEKVGEIDRCWYQQGMGGLSGEYETLGYSRLSRVFFDKKPEISQNAVLRISVPGDTRQGRVVDVKIYTRPGQAVFWVAVIDEESGARVPL